jgi:steroid delta-isomerase-like uncharacterized protein
MTDEADIEALHHRWIASERDGHTEAVLSLCTDGVCWRVPGLGALVGQARVREYLRQHPSPRIRRLDAPITALQVTGDLAVKAARFTTTVDAADGAPAMTYRGRHLWVLGRQGAGAAWRVSEISWVIESASLAGAERAAEARPTADSPEAHKALIRAFVEAINAQDWDALRARLAPDFIRHSLAAGEPGVRSAEALIRFLQAELETFPDAQESLEALVAEGEWVAARHRFRGTQQGPMGAFPPSGRRLDAPYLAFYRIERGRIAEAWAEWDRLAGLQQLGHLAAP